MKFVVLTSLMLVGCTSSPAINQAPLLHRKEATSEAKATPPSSQLVATNSPSLHVKENLLFSLQEGCPIVDGRILYSENKFIFQGSDCEIASMTNFDSETLNLKNCYHIEQPHPSATVTIKTSYNATWLSGWFEEPKKIHFCRDENFELRRQ